MKIYLIVALAIGIFTINQAAAHDDPPAHAEMTGGPCWIWELPLYPVYCVFTDGNKEDHPNPWVEAIPHEEAQ